MIDTTNIGLSREVHHAEQVRDLRIKVAERLLEKYHTAYFSSGGGLTQTQGNRDDPSNFVYQYIQTIIPQIVFANPAIGMTSRQTGNMEAIAACIKQGVNRWVQDQDLVQLLREVAYDSFFPFGVIGIFQGEDPIPKPERISQKDFIRDPYALNKSSMRYTGHRWWIGKQELLDRAVGNPGEGWDEELIRDVDLDKTDGRLDHRRMPSDGLMPKRDELVLYDIVLHGEVMEGFDPERFPSTIHTMLVTGEGETFLAEARPPRPYYGWGVSPYHIFDYGYIPDETYGLSPLVANTAQGETLNRYLTGTIRASLKQKNLVLIDDTDNQLGAKIKHSADQSLIPVQGLDKNKILEVSLGGISEQTLPTIELLSQLLDRNLGLSDAQRGVTPSGVSATATQLAEAGTNIRVDDLEQTFYERTSKMLESVAFYYWDNHRIEVPLGRDAIKELMQVPKLAAQIAEMGPDDIITYQGGERFHAPEGSTFDDLELNVKPHSMRRVSEDLSQQRGLQMIQVVAQLVELKAAAPGAADYEEMARVLGDRMNDPSLVKIFSESQDSANGAPAQAQAPTASPGLPSIGGAGSLGTQVAPGSGPQLAGAR